jgi:hypothetical protein
MTRPPANIPPRTLTTPFSPLDQGVTTRPPPVPAQQRSTQTHRKTASVISTPPRQRTPTQPPAQQTKSRSHPSPEAPEAFSDKQCDLGRSLFKDGKTSSRARLLVEQKLKLRMGGVGAHRNCAVQMDQFFVLVVARPVRKPFPVGVAGAGKICPIGRDLLAQLAVL